MRSATRYQSTPSARLNERALSRQYHSRAAAGEDDRCCQPASSELPPPIDRTSRMCPAAPIEGAVTREVSTGKLSCRKGRARLRLDLDPGTDDQLIMIKADTVLTGMLSIISPVSSRSKGTIVHQKKSRKVSMRTLRIARRSP